MTDFSSYMTSIGTRQYITHCGIYCWINIVDDKINIVEYPNKESILTVLHMVRGKYINLLIPHKKDEDGNYIFTKSNGLILEQLKSMKRYEAFYLRKINTSFKNIKRTLTLFINNRELFSFNRDISTFINYIFGVSFSPKRGFTCSHLVKLYLSELEEYKFNTQLKHIDTISPGEIFSYSSPLIDSEQITIYEINLRKDNLFIFSEGFIILILLLILLVIMIIIKINSKDGFFSTF